MKKIELLRVLLYCTILLFMSCKSDISKEERISTAILLPMKLLMPMSFKN